MKNRSSSQDRKDMYTKERKSKMTEQVAELHQHSSRKESHQSHRSQEISHTMSQQDSTTSHTAHSQESMSNVQTSTSTQQSTSMTSSSTQKVVTGQVTTQQVTSSQTNQSQEMAEWQKIATKEKKHVDYAQSSHFSKVISFICFFLQLSLVRLGQAGFFH